MGPPPANIYPKTLMPELVLVNNWGNSDNASVESSLFSALLATEVLSSTIEMD